MSAPLPPTPTHALPRLFAKPNTRNGIIKQLYDIPDKELNFILPQLWSARTLFQCYLVTISPQP
jgi:peptidoglycan/LPS O-acetylase OafA/YrhL